MTPLLVAKADDWLMRLLGLFMGEQFRSYFWTTYRLPFCRPRICYPSSVKRPYDHARTILHEMVHVKQFNPWYGPIWCVLLATILPLPVFFSGRWFLERHAYMVDIKAGAEPELVIELLWHGYAWCWPRPWMRAWFEKQGKT